MLISGWLSTAIVRATYPTKLMRRLSALPSTFKR